MHRVPRGLGALLRGAAVALVTNACLVPPPPERAATTARELNLASRFGRIHVAGNLTAEKERADFLSRRASWGRDVRIVDVELAGLEMRGADRAEVQVDYAWMRIDENVVRTTRVAQDFRDAGRGFQLVAERCVAGDRGLFGEAAPAQPASRPAERRDVQFETKVIR